MRGLGFPTPRLPGREDTVEKLMGLVETAPEWKPGGEGSEPPPLRVYPLTDTGAA